MQSIKPLISGQSVVPVVAVENKEQTLGLAQALLDGGITVIEVTLRNEFALEALSIIKESFPDMTLLAGTVTSAKQFKQVADIGVNGVISPGITPELASAAVELKVPYLPGVGTASEIVLAMQYGLSEVKLFPATVVGGIPALKAYYGPFPDLQFCPTGGISESNYKDYLALPNVMCVGGSWVAPTQSIRDLDWATITNNCLKLTQ